MAKKIKREEDTVEEIEETSKKTNKSPSEPSSGSNWGSTLLILLIIGGGAFILPKLPAIMAGAGVQGIPGVEPVEVQSTSVEIENLEQGLVLNMRVHNPNSFNADLGRVTYDIYIAGERVASGEKQTYESVSGDSTATISSNIDADLGGSLGAGANILGNTLTGESSSVRVEGKWHYKIGPASFSIPFEDQSQL